jgi:hypothetical protein
MLIYRPYQYINIVPHFRIAARTFFKRVFARLCRSIRPKPKAAQQVSEPHVTWHEFRFRIAPYTEQLHSLMFEGLAVVCRLCFPNGFCGRRL